MKAQILKYVLFAVIGLAVVLIVLLETVIQAKVEQSINRVAPHPPYKIRDETMARHQGLTIMDWHCDSLLIARDLTKRADYGHVDIPRLQEGNVGIQMFTAVTKSPSGQNYEENEADSDNITLLALVQLWPMSTWTSLLERAVYQAEKLHRFAEKAPDALQVVRNREDLIHVLSEQKAARKSGKKVKVAGLLGLEGCHALEGKLENIQALYNAGYRMIGLLHFFDNKVGGSLHGISHAGLTPFGRRVVQELEKRHMIIDLAHASPAVVDDVLAMTRRPMVVSHTGIHSACQSPRNISDQQMTQIADRGGLIAIGYWEGAICDITPAGAVKSLRAAIDLVGEDHVALGSDFDGSTLTRFDASELAVLTQGMVDAGFTDSEITKVMGANSVRFLLENLPR